MVVSGIFDPTDDIPFGYQEECQEGLKYTSVNSNGELRQSNLPGMMFAYLRRGLGFYRGYVIM